VAVEELGAGEGEPLDLSALDGTWRLCYTSASDVLVLFEAAERLPLLQVSECVNQSHLAPRCKLAIGCLLRDIT
jgi:hypothetical protein